MYTIAYQGVKGAFSYLTALKGFGSQCHYIGCSTFKEVYDCVECGQADYAVLPIENSLIGSIYENYDLLTSYEMQIVGEQYTKIEHCLHVLPGSSLSDITKVMSHPKALEQCKNFFETHPWIKAVVYCDTAAAAEMVSHAGDPTCGAIASEACGPIYGLEVLQKSIEDDPKNYTRFVSLTKKGIHHPEATKCSLMLQINHIPGSLAEILSIFSRRGLNMTKIESRPLRGSLFEYQFYIDVEYSEGLEGVFDELKIKSQSMRVLGCYKGELYG